MKKIFSIGLLVIFLPILSFGQGNLIGKNLRVKQKSKLIQDVTIGSSSFNSSAILTIESSSKGLLIPRMTTVQKNDISTPPTGLLLYDTDLNKFQYYNGGWLDVGISDLSTTLSVGNTTGANDIIVTAGQKITVDAIQETTADAGVAIEQITLENKGAYSDITAVGGNAMIEFNRYENDISITSDAGGFSVGGAAFFGDTQSALFFDGVARVNVGPASTSMQFGGGHSITLNKPAAINLIKIFAGTGEITLGNTTDKIGFYATTPVVQQAQTIDLKDAIVNLGLIASGAGATPLDLDGGNLTCDSAKIGVLKLSGIFADSIISANSFTGNLANSTTKADTLFTGVLILTDYIRHHDINVSSATQGTTAPTATTVGTFRGLGYDADNEASFFVIEIPVDWNGISDMILSVHWYPTSGDAVANGETVKWDLIYRSIAEGDAVDNGTAVTATATFTGGASETDKEHYETSITIDYDNGDQPLTVGDDIGFQFARDVSGDTYSGAGIVYKWDLEYISNTIPR